MAADQQGPPKPSNTNHYILAALGVTLAATIVVIIISLILSPSHITFSVVHASRKVSADGNQIVLTVTMAANNPSHRCKAKYKGIIVDLKNTTKTAGKSSIHAGVQGTEFPTGYIKGPSVTLVTASVALLGNAGTAEATSYAARADVIGLTVEVRALVSFKIGVTPTRSYEMTVFCPGVVFHDEDSSINSSAQQGSFVCTG